MSNRPKLTLAVDFDLVMYPSDVHWVDWLNQVYDNGEYLRFPYQEGKPELYKKYNYNTGSYFSDFKERTGLEPHDFWDNPFLYDVMHPISGSVDVLRKVKESGNNVVVVSHCKGEHLSSKTRAIKKNYPFIDLNPQSKDGFIATKEKSIVRADAMIDDRYYNLKGFPDETLKIYFNTKWEDELFKASDVDLITSVSNPWVDIEEFLVDYGFIK